MTARSAGPNRRRHCLAPETDHPPAAVTGQEDGPSRVIPWPRGRRFAQNSPAPNPRAPHLRNGRRDLEPATRIPEGVRIRFPTKSPTETGQQELTDAFKSNHKYALNGARPKALDLGWG